MRDEDLTREIIGAAIEVHRQLGPGLLESVYEVTLAYELGKRGLEVATQVPIPAVYDGVRMDQGFRADLIVAGRVLIEVKSVASVTPVFLKVVKTYLRFTGLRIGLLINFHEATLTAGLTRVVLDYVEE